MSSFQPTHDLDLVFGSLNFDNFNPQSHHDKILHDLMEDHHPSFIQNDIINFSTPPSNCKQQRPRQTRNSDVYGHRRVLHRDLERKRRQEMSGLYASLRSLLPLHLIKGKRSICDHMNEAANYITQMKKSIHELQIQRDKLKNKNGSFNNLPNSVTVNFAGNHVHILISCSYKSTDLGLSKVFLELLQREISVVNCVSTKTKGKFLHQILAKASETARLDLATLQQRLSLAID